MLSYVHVELKNKNTVTNCGIVQCRTLQYSKIGSAPPLPQDSVLQIFGSFERDNCSQRILIENGQSGLIPFPSRPFSVFISPSQLYTNGPSKKKKTPFGRKKHLKKFSPFGRKNIPKNFAKLEFKFDDYAL